MASSDWFTAGFGRIVADLRHKLVEEGWFGREVTPAADDSSAPSLDQALGWAQRMPENNALSAEQKGSEHGIDR